MIANQFKRTRKSKHFIRNYFHYPLFSKRAIFQTFWKVHCCTKSLFFEIETSNFGSSYVFSSPLKWQGWIWPNLTFWIQKRHIIARIIQVKCRYHYSKIFVSWVRDFKLWLLAYFLISFNCAKFQQDWTTLTLEAVHKRRRQLRGGEG